MPEPMSPEGYAATGGHACPACGGRDLSRQQPQYQYTYVLQRVQCENCAATWHAVYEISGYEDMRLAQEDEPHA